MAILQESLNRNSTSRYLRLAANTAIRSDHSIHKMGAIVVRKGHIIGWGYNKNRSHPKSKSYEHMIHAELAALLNAGFIEGTADADLYIVRITKGGSMATSKPCNDCMDLIKEAGIRNITFVCENGTVKKEEVL